MPIRIRYTPVMIHVSKVNRRQKLMRSTGICTVRQTAARELHALVLQQPRRKEKVDRHRHVRAVLNRVDRPDPFVGVLRGRPWPEIQPHAIPLFIGKLCNMLPAATVMYDCSRLLSLSP